MTAKKNLDAIFSEAVAAMDAGNIDLLRQLLDGHPELVSDRLDTPGPWLRDMVGNAIDTGQFFERPYLLWFVAEDPVRNGKLPRNIAEAARAIILAAQTTGAASLQAQLDYALRLVALSWIARDCGVQLELIDVLVDAGASPDGHGDHALVNRNVEAAAHLIARGARPTLATTIFLDRWEEVPRRWSETGEREKRYVFVLAALHGRAKALRWMLGRGADPNRISEDLFSHGTPLHHAACSGSLEAVQLLAEAGANLETRDTVWNATPAEWADYQAGQATDREAQEPYAQIAAYLRKCEGPS